MPQLTRQRCDRICARIFHKHIMVPALSSAFSSRDFLSRLFFFNDFLRLPDTFIRNYEAGIFAPQKPSGLRSVFRCAEFCGNVSERYGDRCEIIMIAEQFGKTAVRNVYRNGTDRLSRKARDTRSPIFSKSQLSLDCGYIRLYNFFRYTPRTHSGLTQQFCPSRIFGACLFDFAEPFNAKFAASAAESTDVSLSPF